MRPKKLIDIEKSLGFIWVSSIFGGVGGGCGVPIVEQFSNDVKLLTENFRDYQPNRLSKSTKFHVQCDELYRRHAPLLWPPKEVDRRDWLVNTDDNETGDGLYPRNLYYEDKGDTLRDLFVELIFEICVRHRNNIMRRLRRQQRRQDEEDDWKVSGVQDSEQEAITSRQETITPNDDLLPITSERQSEHARRYVIPYYVDQCNARCCMSAPVPVMVPSGSGNFSRRASHQTLVKTLVNDGSSLFPPLQGVQRSTSQIDLSLTSNSLSPPSTHSVPNSRLPLHYSTTARKRPAPCNRPTTSRTPLKLSKTHDERETRRSKLVIIKLPPRKLMGIAQKSFAGSNNNYGGRTSINGNQSSDADTPLGTSYPVLSTPMPLTPPPESVQEREGVASSRTNDAGPEISTPKALDTSAPVTATRIMNIELVNNDANHSKFICVDTRTSVEDLFARVQKRMNQGREVKALLLHLPTRTRSYSLDSDDPDTWKMLIRHTGGSGEDEIDVTGNVEF